jgi:putative transposase
MRHYDRYRRQSHRLAGYDYRQAGLYFITICTKDRLHYFGQVCNSEMLLSDMGMIVRDYWMNIPQLHPHVFLGEFVVMPNHIHGVLGIDSESIAIPAEKSASSDIPEDKNDYMASISPKSGSVARIIGSYKAACTSTIRNAGTETFSWQPRFHDHIIRNPQALERIENYIRHNPQKWAEDKFFEIGETVLA